MEKKVIYLNRIPLRLLFLAQVICGLFLLSVFLYLLKIKVYPDIWTFAGPLLGLAMLITGLTGSKIKKISLQTPDNQISITREALFRRKIITKDLGKMSVELKLASGKKDAIFPKIKVVIMSSEREIEKLESGFLSHNNSKIKDLYYDLKNIIQDNLDGY